MLDILIRNCWLLLIECFFPIIFLLLGISIFCAKKKAVAEHKPSHKGVSSVKKNNKDNNESEKRNKLSSAEQPTTKKEKSKSKSKSKVDKPKKSVKKEPPKHHGESKTDPFEGAEGDDKEGGKDKDETLRKTQSKSKSKKRKDKRGLPNKDGYDDLNPNKKDGKGKHGLPNKDGYDDLIPNKKDDEDVKSKMKTEETKSKMQGKDDGYENVDPTKNVNREDVNMNESNGNEKSPSPKSKRNKPRQIPRDAKQQKIAKGAKKGKGDYPTMDDVISDWDSKKEPADGSPAAAGGGGPGAAGGCEESKVKPPAKQPTITDEGSEEKFQLKSRARTDGTQPS